MHTALWSEDGVYLLYGALGDMLTRKAPFHKDNYSSPLLCCTAGSEIAPQEVILRGYLYPTASVRGQGCLSADGPYGCGLLDTLVAVDSEVTELFFDAEELVVLSHTVGTAERTGLDLTRVRSYSDVSDRSIFRLTRAV